MNSVNSSSDGFSATKADLVARAPYPKLNTSAPPPTMAAMPNGKPGPSRTLFTQPQRQAGRGPSAPSTISTASSTSSGATIRPPVTTPRALSPTSGHSQLPFARDGFRRMSSIPGGKKGQLKQHPHWDDPAKVAQDIALLDEKSVLEGLSWRLDQYLDIQEPFGLIVPEMVEAARMDPNDVCGPALDMLMSAIFADGDPPVCEIPRVQTDASGNQYANYTVPLTCKNSPDALKNLFTSWSSVVQRLKSLDPRFHSEIARIICDMEPLENPLLPQVMLIAHDLKVIAKEISLRRSFLAKFDAAFLQMLQESDGGTLPPFRRKPTLPFLPEAPEPSSSSSSRSSSRHSHRSRHRTRSLSNSRREKASEGELHNRIPPSGLRSRSSSIHSLRLDKDGIPLTDAEIAAEGLVAATGSEHIIGHAQEHNQRLGQNGNAVHIKRPSSSNGDRTNEYSKIAPMVIPAFSNDNDSYSPPNPNAPLGHLQHLRRLEAPLQHHSAPVSPSGPVIANLPHSRDGDMPARPLPKPGAPSSDIAMPNPLPSKVIGPRPLPRMPSPKPKAPTHPPQPPPTQNGISALPTSQQGGITLPIVVPDQSVSSSLVPLIESLSIQIPSQPMAVTGFEVPSATDISDVVEVPSSSPHDLHIARLAYAMESSSSLPYMDDRYPSLNKKRHGQVNMPGLGVGGGVPPRPATAEPTFTRGMPNGIQFQSRDEPWAVPRSSSSASHYATGGGQPNGYGWTPPTDWDNPPPPPPKDDDRDKEKEPSGFFRGIKTLLGKGDKGGSSSSAASQIQESAPLSRPQDSRAQSQQSHYARGPIPHPDNNMAYYQGVGSSQTAQFSPYDYSSVPSSAGSRVQVPIVNGHGQVPYSIPSHQYHPSGPPPPASRQPANAHGLLSTQQVPSESPGFAQEFQKNPVAAQRYHGAGSSQQLYDYAHPVTSTFGAYPATRTAPTSSSEPAGLVAIRETMYGAIIEALSTEALRKAMAKDEQRAYFSAMSLAILNVSMTLQSSTDSPNIVHMLTGDVRLSDLPGPYRTSMTELAAIGREARKLGEEDDERAIAYVARGKELPEPRVSRVRRLLERGVGYVDSDGRVRGASSGQGGTGRSREFSNKINSLAVDMMKLPAFREDMLRGVAP